MTSLAIAGCLCGCAGAESHSGSTEIRDTAGITIVENRAPEDGPAAAWSLTAEPAVSIGVLEGDPHYQLFRVVGATRLSDGRIVVANSGTHELRFYDADGEFLSAVGGEGGGPGEFTQLGTVQRYGGDSLLAYDWSNRRISIFDSDGAFVRSFLLESPEENAFAVWVSAEATCSRISRPRSARMRCVRARGRTRLNCCGSPLTDGSPTSSDGSPGTSSTSIRWVTGATR